MRETCSSWVINVGARRLMFAAVAALGWGTVAPGVASAAGKFKLEEATIEDIHGAIKNGQITCKGLVQAYMDRVKAYNGVCTKLVTAKGESIPAAMGTVRAGASLRFPTRTTPGSSLLPNLDQYVGLPLEFGRMEATASDPNVKQQYGMVAGVPNAGQLSAFETLNIRGERSVTCKGKFDAPPGTPLPAGAPAACEQFRQHPDALELATQLDAQYGSKPDLERLPMYCTVITVKNWYDVNDMRSTGGNDVNYATDFAPWDMTIVSQLRAKGAIISGITIASEPSFRDDEPAKPKTSFVGGSNVRSSWGGTTCNPYDTERSPGGSSGGAGASVAANMATCSICETTGGSCRIPANANAVASFVTTKGLTSEFGSATADFINHRPGVLCRTIGDAARVIDAMKDPKDGYFDSRDFLTALPRALSAREPYASSIVSDTGVSDKPLKGLRIGIVREYMVKHTPNDAATSDQIDQEFKTILRDRLGAELVESVDPQYPDDPDVANMRYTFADAFSEVLPISAPEYFFQKTSDGKLEFEVPGYDVTSRDYLVKLSLRQAPLSAKLNMRRIFTGLDDGGRDDFMIARYLTARGDQRVADTAAYAANSKWRSEAQAVGVQNVATINLQDTRTTKGIDRVKMHTLFRYAIMKVMRENHIDVFVHPNLTIPMGKIGSAQEPDAAGRRANGFAITDVLGVPEIIVPAGFNDVIYEPAFVLSDDKKSYVQAAGKSPSKLSNPLPISIEYWAGPGDEPVMLKVASAYEAATHHRKPPAAFPALKGGM
ncbi:MAG TPA: amidase family protein [Steroidobacteraceae bacterium]|nr:amidase family protein [Steroidobacteraceae bacterium]